MSVAQLNGARELVKHDATQFEPVLDGILQIASRKELDLRRWCSLFLIDAFINQDVSSTMRENMARKSADTLIKLLEDPDHIVKKHAITAVSSVYPILFRLVANGWDDQRSQAVFEQLSSIKQLVFNAWNETTHLGVLTACIKFGQCLVLVQCKHPDAPTSHLPQKHPLLDRVALFAEGQGTFDRILEYFTEKEIAVPTFCASLHAVAPLVSERPQFGSKIVTALVRMDLASTVIDSAGGSGDLAFKFIEKALQLVLRAIAPAGDTSVPRFLGSLAGLRSRKRSFESENEAGKRQRVDSPSPAAPQELSSLPFKPYLNPLPTDGAVSFKQLYNLLQPNDPLSEFSARSLNVGAAVQLALQSMKRAEHIDEATDIILRRYAELQPVTTSTESGAATASLKREMRAATDDVNSSHSETSNGLASDFDAGSHRVQKLSESQRRVVMERTFDRLRKTSENAPAPESFSADQKLRRALFTKHASDSWVYLVSRIATRGVLENSVEAEVIRERLFQYCMDDFRRNLPVIISWLSEEWFAAKVLYADTRGENKTDFYFDTLERILDQISPRLELSDSKLCIRLLSDLPALNRNVVFKMRCICKDPELAVLGARTLKFLIMFKPPVKEDCLDLVQELVEEGMDSLSPILRKYRDQC